MFNWWMGKGAGPDHVENDVSEIEPPETPAPVFAARALKSALFGTPGLVDDDTIYDFAQEIGTTAAKETRFQSADMSPTKPPGILLTPGTATSRRKTVSFGHEVVEKEKNITGRAIERMGMPRNLLGSQASPLETKGEHLTTAARKTTLTRSLESARESKNVRDELEKPRGSAESQPLLNSGAAEDTITSKKSPSRYKRIAKSQNNEQDKVPQTASHEDLDGDVTVDLNEPHSQSGRYWKSEYDSYHSEAKIEMRRLLKYKHLAKTYAKKKDEENIDLAERLKEEQRRVISMEDKIANLTTQIALAGLDGQDDDTPELTKELARQTALALEYKSKVEEFRTALEETATSEEKHSGTKGSAISMLEMQREPNGAKEQLSRMDSLQQEISKLRQTLSTSERTNRKLQEENSKLTQELLLADLRLEKQAEMYEKRRQSSNESQNKKVEILQSLQKDYDELKEQAKLQRRDAEHLLKKRHDQVVQLKKEIVSIRGAETIANKLQEALKIKTSEHDEVVANLKQEITELRKTFLSTSKRTANTTESNKTKDEHLLMSDRKLTSSADMFSSRESFIPVYSQSSSRPSKSVAASRGNRSEAASPARQNSHAALSEIINNASPSTIPPQCSGPVQFTPATNRSSADFMPSPPGHDLRLPSPEPSFAYTPGRTIHERKCHASPRPSMFNIASSPPKVVITRPLASSHGLSSQKSMNNSAEQDKNNMASSRISNMEEDSRTRRTLPPERAAAARARLEQKQAEKRKAKETQQVGKENVRD